MCSPPHQKDQPSARMRYQCTAVSKSPGLKFTSLGCDNGRYDRMAMPLLWAILPVLEISAAAFRVQRAQLPGPSARRLSPPPPPRLVPHGVTLLGRLFEEGTVARVGLALERSFNVMSEHPPGF